jgi:restriction endonuclease Mrr
MSSLVVPDFQTIMLPLLEFARDDREHPLSEAIEYLVIHFNLTDAERKELLPSGKQPVFDNRVGWARTHLKKAGLLTYPSHRLGLDVIYIQAKR